MTDALLLDVAVSACECAVKDCLRVVQPGEIVHLRPCEPNGFKNVEPLCPVHAAEHMSDLQLRVRLRMHADRQRTIPYGVENPPSSRNTGE